MHRNFTVSQILRYLYASRGGLCETELLALIPHLTVNFLSVFTEVLTDHLVLKYQGGLLTFAHEQVSLNIQCIIRLFPSVLIKLDFFLCILLFLGLLEMLVCFFVHRLGMQFRTTALERMRPNLWFNWGKISHDTSHSSWSKNWFYIFDLVYILCFMFRFDMYLKVKKFAFNLYLEQ